jgi:FkbM family methyltransferase
MSRREKISRNLREAAAAVKSGPGARQRLGRRYAFDAMRQISAYGGAETPAGTMFFSTEDRTVGRQIYVEGGWEPHLLPRVLEIGGIDPSGKVLLDVGANIGTTSIPAARLGARVIAFEPVESNFRLLRANVAVNRLDDQITTIHAACSDTNGELKMTLSRSNSGDHRVSDVGDVSVPSIRLDDALASLGNAATDVALIWMDTQGHEASVLAGAVELLKFQRPLLMEFWPAALGDSIGKLRDALAPYQNVIDMQNGQVTSWPELLDRYRDGFTDVLLM